MDWHYILYNSIVYWGMAFVFSAMYVYGKVQHLGIGALMIAIWYLIRQYITHWFSLIWLWWVWALLGFYWVTNWILLKMFPNETQRDLLSIIFTIAISMLIENTINYIYWASSVSLTGIEISLPVLGGIFLGLNAVLLYAFGQTIRGKIMHGISERVQVMRSLGVTSHKLQQRTFWAMLVILALVAILVLAEWNMRWSDSIFYFLKWIWISILVWFGNKKWVFIGAFIYVLLEYLIFIVRNLPIVYKESLILSIILLVIILKPEWLFSIGKRHL